MRSEQEIRDLKEELEKLTGFISENTAPGKLCREDEVYACNVCDALGWVLEDILTDNFKTDAYLKLNKLKHSVRVLERMTGKKLTNPA